MISMFFFDDFHVFIEECLHDISSKNATFAKFFFVKTDHLTTIRPLTLKDKRQLTSFAVRLIYKC